MPKIIVNAFLTLDGVMQAPGGPDEDGEGGFPHGGWQFPYSDEAAGKIIVDGLADASAFLLGRKTYDIFAGYWPKVTDPANPIAAALNSRPKYVASRTLKKVEWSHAKLLGADTLAELSALREAPGTGVHTWGSTGLLQTLLRHGFVDELRAFVFPLVLGTGKRLFQEGIDARALTLLESRPLAKGALYLRYRPAGKPTYGTMGA